MNRKLISVGSVMLAIAVMIGAFGAHALSEHLKNIGRLDTYQTGVQYHFYHAFGLVLTGLASDLITMKYQKIIGWLFGLGLLFFSGSLYLTCLTDNSIFGVIAPMGGLAFIAAWSTFAFGVYKGKV